MILREKSVGVKYESAAWLTQTDKEKLSRNDLGEVYRGASALLGRLFNFYPSVSRRPIFRIWSALKYPTVS